MKVLCPGCKVYFFIKKSKTKGKRKPGRAKSHCTPACRQRAFYWRFKSKTGRRYKSPSEPAPEPTPAATPAESNPDVSA